ncbi:O-antigen ligase [Luteimonas sp. J16]|jgi:putative inorganic carbon (HCO3(-)) transporter|uniref:O-antigen ligase family protein n=1 Tax=unclassified Luteimonas TaxID=2629088 RepID=UPI0004B850DC|nr:MULTISPECIES: O-antigen ligase family protein [unclassified Luteimonas]TWG87990.1 O-antigen ligase [Luteimonas sp. J16]
MLLYAFIMVYVLLVLIRPQEYPQWPLSGVPVLPLALVAALGVWLLSRNKRFDAPQYVLILVFLVVTSLSVMLTGWSGGALQQFSEFATIVVSFFLLANALDSRERVVGAMAVFTVSAAVLALHGAHQAANGVGWTGAELVGDGRIQYVGIFSDPNDLGMLFVACMPMAAYLGSRGGLMGLRRLFWWGICVVLLYGVYLTHSRGALLSVIAMSGIWVLVRRGVFAAGSLAVIALAGLLAMPSRVSEIDVQEESAAGRVEAWYEGLQMFLSSPVFGVGTGNFTEYHYLTAHNSLVLVLAENGIVGMTVWLAFVGYCFWMMVRILRHEPDFVEGEEELAWEWYEDRAVALTLLASLVGFFTAAFFLSRSYVILLYLLAAVVVAHFCDVRDRHPAVPALQLRDHLARWPVIGVAAVVGLYLVVKVLLALG